MTTAIRAIRTGGGIHAARHYSLAGNQPLKPAYSTKRLRVLLFVLLCSMGLMVQQNFQDISHFVNRPVTKVRIDNQLQHISDAEVTAMLAAYMGDGFFNFDVIGVKQKLEQHAWISTVSVRRIWPDSLSLLLTEQMPIARWGDGQLLNQQGEIFEPSSVANLAALPKLVGPAEGQYEVMEQFQLISQILFPAGLRLNELSLSPRGSWGLILNENMQVSVGRHNVMERLKRFVEFYDAQAATQTANYRTVDLRYINGIAVSTVQENIAGVATR